MNVRILLPADILSLLVYTAIMTGVANWFDVPLFQILPLLVAWFSKLAADDKPVTPHAIEIGVAEQFKPLTVYMSCSVFTFNDNIWA